MNYRHVLLMLVAAAALLVFVSCEDDPAKPPETKTPVTGDLYPLNAGNKIRFNGYLRHAQDDTNITATGAFYVANMTVSPVVPPLPPIVHPQAGTTFFILDSSLVNPAPVWYVSGFYVKRTSATSGDFYFLTNAGRFYRQTGVQRTDSLKWILLVKEGVNVGDSWVAFDSTYTSAVVGSARLKIDAKFEAKETITVNSQSIEAYKLVATRAVYVGGSSIPATEGATATIWLVSGGGIVKFIFNSDGETPGFDRNFLNRNF